VTDAVEGALDVAEAVADTLARHGVSTVLIGAAAMAVHGYPRATQDLDLATVEVPAQTLRAVAAALREAGHAVTLREPDADDPLGGLLRVEAGDDLQVDVVNFGNPWTGSTRRLGHAVLNAPARPLAGRRLAVVDVPTLVLLKLAAGSRLDLRDAAELLARHPGLDRAALRTQCEALRLDKKLDRVLADLAVPDDDEPVP
jgi:hypothetical protein